MDQISASPFTTDIHPEDHLYGYLHERLGDERAKKAYFEGGKLDAAQTVATIRRLKKESNIKVLEFASGYGRVTRHLRDLLPGASLFASDIHPQACEFVTTNIRVPTLQSSARPEDLNVGGGYDFVFVISLFSHLPDSSFGRWINALTNTLAPGGYLMFTTHGDVSMLRYKGMDLKQFEQGDGWVYIRRSDQPDIADDDYGTMLVEPTYVTRSIAGCAPAQLRSFTSAAWFGHQDEWVIQRVS